MVSVRFTSLLLGLMLSLATLGESVATTHQAIDALANSRHKIIPNKELHVDETEAAVAATTRRKWLGGRKMAMDDAAVKKEMVKGNIINTGNGVLSPSPFGSPWINDHKEAKLRMQRSSAYAFKSQNLEEATEELYNMLNKDYHIKSRRRPPINNDQPLEGISVDDP